MKLDTGCFGKINDIHDGLSRSESKRNRLNLRRNKRSLSLLLGLKKLLNKCLLLLELLKQGLRFCLLLSEIILQGLNLGVHVIGASLTSRACCNHDEMLTCSEMNLRLYSISVQRKRVGFDTIG